MMNRIEQLREVIDKTTVTRKEIAEAAEKLGFPCNTKLLKQLQKVSHGVYNLELAAKKEDNVVTFKPKKAQAVTEVTKGYVPERDVCFVPFGDFNVIDAVVKSKKFMPVVITGDSGNGKTKMVEQACAKNKRNFYRMNITVETDEMDILGHYNLINGETIWEDSPLVEAAKTGGVVLLDEIFAGNPARMLALQGILEGKPFLVKKTGERIMPVEGFNIIATDNTKGNGSDTGRYIGTNIQNTAFLERFVMCIEHDYPSKTKETRMLDKYIEAKSIPVDDDFFSEKLCQWAEVTRKSYKDEAIDEMITTRRLFHILDIYSVLRDKEKAILYAIARFDDEVRDAFISLYKKIDDTIFDDNHEPIDPNNMMSTEDVIQLAWDEFSDHFNQVSISESKKKLSDQLSNKALEYAFRAVQLEEAKTYIKQTYDRTDPKDVANGKEYFKMLFNFIIEGFYDHVGEDHPYFRKGRTNWSVVENPEGFYADVVLKVQQEIIY